MLREGKRAIARSFGRMLSCPIKQTVSVRRYHRIPMAFLDVWFCFVMFFLIASESNYIVKDIPTHIGHMDDWECQALYINQIWYNKMDRYYHSGT